jgi:hypothetical protein
MEAEIFDNLLNPCDNSPDHPVENEEDDCLNNSYYVVDSENNNYSVEDNIDDLFNQTYEK